MRWSRDGTKLQSLPPWDTGAKPQWHMVLFFLNSFRLPNILSLGRRGSATQTFPIDAGDVLHDIFLQNVSSLCHGQCNSNSIGIFTFSKQPITLWSMASFGILLRPTRNLAFGIGYAKWIPQYICLMHTNNINWYCPPCSYLFRPFCECFFEVRPFSNPSPQYSGGKAGEDVDVIHMVCCPSCLFYPYCMLLSHPHCNFWKRIVTLLRVTVTRRREFFTMEIGFLLLGETTNVLCWQVWHCQGCGVHRLFFSIILVELCIVTCTFVLWIALNPKFQKVKYFFFECYLSRVFIL